jgi:hypothetical protein
LSNQSRLTSAATVQKGGQTTVRVRVIDWEQPANHDFLLVSQFRVTGALYTCRPDLVGFVNGLPLVVIELKKPGVPARGERAWAVTMAPWTINPTTSCTPVRVPSTGVSVNRPSERWLQPEGHGCSPRRFNAGQRRTKLLPSRG